MARLSIAAEESEALEVDLWGSIFTVVPITQHRRLKIAEIMAEAMQVAARTDKDAQTLDPLADDYVDRVKELTQAGDENEIGMLAKAYDVALAAVDGGKKKPSTVVKQSYRDGRVGKERLGEFLEEIMELDRPT